MFALLNRVVITLAIVALSACVSVGRDFARPNMESMRSFNPDYDQIKSKYGKPWSEGSITENGKNIIKLTYGFGTNKGRPHKGDSVSVRTMEYYFFNNTMVGYDYFSSVRQDNTDFDETKRNAIINKKTTRSEVVALLGAPSGFRTYPMISATSGEAAVYMYIDYTKDQDYKISTVRHLLVTYDVAGVVQDVNYSTETSKKPTNTTPNNN